MRRQIEVRSATAILMIVGFFCVAWTPYCIIALIGLFGDVRMVTPLASAVPCVLAKMATVSNPPLYSLGHPKFRKKIAYLVKHYFRRSLTSSASRTVNGNAGQGGAGGIVRSRTPPTTFQDALNNRNEVSL